MANFSHTVHSRQVSRSHYQREGFSPLRIENLTQQLREICDSECKKVLEIGVGRGLLRHMLQPFPEISYVGFDIDESLYPDYVGSVTDMPFADRQFELTMCCEVLEHLPLEELPVALKEIRRVTEKKVIISLPDKRKHSGVALRIPGISNWVKWGFNLDPPGLGCKKFDGQHYWEIGYKGSRGRTILRHIREAGFTIERQYRLERHRWHCFFILSV